jgi:hypothetical protein
MRIILAALLAGALAVPANAAQCPLSGAIYGQPDSSAEIWFSPLPAGSPEPVANAFSLRLGGYGPPLPGSVGWTLEFDRPSADLSVDCPQASPSEGGCAIWQGVIYAVHADGSVWLLPDEKEDPPPTIILSDLGRSIREADGVAGSFRTDEPVWDAFTLRGCAP